MFGQNDNDNKTDATNQQSPLKDAALGLGEDHQPTDQVSSSESGSGEPIAVTVDNTTPSSPPVSIAVGQADDLLSIKQTALQHLSPLLGHLDQTPEEKFRTTMMMIQASDDQSLVKTAYEAAATIEDEKIRAQALLDVVNEINYFTQKHQDPTSKT